MNEIMILETIASKRGKGVGKGDCQEAVQALLGINDNATRVKFLSALHYKICLNYILEFSEDASARGLKSLLRDLLDETNMTGDRPDFHLYPVGFAAVFALVSRKKYVDAFMMLDRILPKAEEKNGFAKSAQRSFMLLLEDTNIMPEFLDLLHQAESGKVKTANAARLRAFLDALSLDMPEAHSPESPAEKKKRGPKPKDAALLQEQAIGILTEKPSEESSVRFVEQVNEISFNILQNIESTTAETLATVKKMADQAGPRDQTMQKGTQADTATLKAEINELKDRLRLSYEMDDMAKNQEMATLIGKISRTVSLDYQDFEKSKNEPINEDLFKMYRVMLARIFKHLKRMGIPLE